MRICLGKHPTLNEHGLWITKPGKSVLTATEDDFLFSPSRYAGRLYASGYNPGIRWFLGETRIQVGATNRFHWADFQWWFAHDLDPAPDFYVTGHPGVQSLANRLETVVEEIIYATSAFDGSNFQYAPNYNSGTETYTRTDLAFSWAIYANEM